MKVTPFGRSPRFRRFGTVLSKNLAALRRGMFIMSGLVVQRGSISGSAILYPRPGPERGSRLSTCKKKGTTDGRSHISTTSARNGSTRLLNDLNASLCWSRNVEDPTTCEKMVPDKWGFALGSHWIWGALPSFGFSLGVWVFGIYWALGIRDSPRFPFSSQQQTQSKNSAQWCLLAVRRTLALGKPVAMVANRREQWTIDHNCQFW